MNRSSSDQTLHDSGGSLAEVRRLLPPPFCELNGKRKVEAPPHWRGESSASAGETDGAGRRGQNHKAKVPVCASTCQAGELNINLKRRASAEASFSGCRGAPGHCEVPAHIPHYAHLTDDDPRRCSEL